MIATTARGPGTVSHLETLPLQLELPLLGEASYGLHLGLGLCHHPLGLVGGGGESCLRCEDRHFSRFFRSRPARLLGKVAFICGKYGGHKELGFAEASSSTMCNPVSLNLWMGNANIFDSHTPM